jgi:hypothetical protein
MVSDAETGDVETTETRTPPASRRVSRGVLAGIVALIAVAGFAAGLVIARGDDNTGTGLPPKSW